MLMSLLRKFLDMFLDISMKVMNFTIIVLLHDDLIFPESLNKWSMVLSSYNVEV